VIVSYEKKVFFSCSTCSRDKGSPEAIAALAAVSWREDTIPKPDGLREAAARANPNKIERRMIKGRTLSGLVR
jgi:hypothetical protein